MSPQTICIYLYKPSSVKVLEVKKDGLSANIGYGDNTVTINAVDVDGVPADIVVRCTGEAAARQVLRSTFDGLDGDTLTIRATGKMVSGWRVN